MTYYPSGGPYDLVAMTDDLKSIDLESHRQHENLFILDLEERCWYDPDETHKTKFRVLPDGEVDIYYENGDWKTKQPI